MSAIGIELICFGALLVVIGFSLHVRSLFKRDLAPPDLHTEWQSNAWLNAKHTLLGTWKQ